MFQMDLTVLETKLYHVEGTEEEIKAFSLIKKISTFQNFDFDRKVLIWSENANLKAKNTLKFETFKFELETDWKVLQTKLYDL